MHELSLQTFFSQYIVIINPKFVYWKLDIYVPYAQSLVKTEKNMSICILKIFSK